MNKSRFKLASQGQQRKGGFTLASQQRDTNKPQKFRKSSLIISEPEPKKTHKQVKLIVDSFYPNGIFDEVKYKVWLGKVKQKISEKMRVELTCKQRSEIRDELYERTQKDLQSINFK